MKIRKNALVALSALGACAAAPSTAHAASFYNAGMGGEDGNPTTTSPNSLYFNPGAMAFSEGSQLGAYGAVTLRRATWTKTGASTDIADPADGQGTLNTGEAKVLNLLGGVSSFGATLHLGNLVLGAGFFAPFAGPQTFSKNNNLTPAEAAKYPLATNGIQRFFGDYDYGTVLYMTGGAAYRLGPLSIGASGNFISTTLVHNESRSFSGPTKPSTLWDGTSNLEVSGFEGSYGLGAMLELLPKQLWIGGSYQAQPGLGPITLTGWNTAGAEGTPLVPKHVNYTESLPDMARVGIRWRPKGAPLEIRVFGDLTRWSVYKANCTSYVGYNCEVDANGAVVQAPGVNVLQNSRTYYNDTKSVRLGVSYWTNPDLELFLGGGFDQSAIPDATMNPDSFDANTVRGTLGVKFKLARFLRVTVAYTQYYSFTRDNTGKSELAQINGVQVSVPTYQEDAGGIYTNWEAQLGINTEVNF